MPVAVIAPSVLSISMTVDVIPRSYAPFGLRVVCEVPVSTTRASGLL
jgi:hypothetical protein